MTDDPAHAAPAPPPRAADCPVCPNCGFDLKHIEVIERDDWMVYRTGEVAYRKALIPFDPQERHIVQTLMRMDGMPIKGELLLDRMGSASKSASLSVRVSNIRRKLRDAGAPSKIELLKGLGPQAGYYWRW